MALGAAEQAHILVLVLDRDYKAPQYMDLHHTLNSQIHPDLELEKILVRFLLPQWRVPFQLLTFYLPPSSNIDLVETLISLKKSQCKLKYIVSKLPLILALFVFPLFQSEL